MKCVYIFKFEDDIFFYKFINKLDIVIINKKAKEILIIEIGVTSQDNLQQVESEKIRKYDVLANELTLIHGFTSKIVPYVITWDDISTKYNAKYRKFLGITDRIQAYIQSITLKKTLESISMEYRCGGDLTEDMSTRNNETLRMVHRPPVIIT